MSQSLASENKKLRKVLLAIFLDREQVAVNSHETCTYPGSIFNDKIWAEDDSSFSLYKTAREVLGLPEFTYRNKTKFGDARKSLDRLRNR